MKQENLEIEKKLGKFLSISETRAILLQVHFHFYGTVIIESYNNIIMYIFSFVSYVHIKLQTIV